MIIKKTEIVIYLDDALPEKLPLPSISKKIMAKAAKKEPRKKALQGKRLAKKELWVVNFIVNNINV